MDCHFEYTLLLHTPYTFKQNGMQYIVNINFLKNARFTVSVKKKQRKGLETILDILKYYMKDRNSKWNNELRRFKGLGKNSSPKNPRSTKMHFEISQSCCFWIHSFKFTYIFSSSFQNSLVKYFFVFEFFGYRHKSIEKA